MMMHGLANPEFKKKLIKYESVRIKYDEFVYLALNIQHRNYIFSVPHDTVIRGLSYSMFFFIIR
jgi:hypothetical protein